MSAWRALTESWNLRIGRRRHLRTSSSLLRPRQNPA
uniref:Uncharacterized protein n=1 Tax=Arundo donax TaxID=35708 RepID=A0A0A8XP72_ARUDO